MPQQAILAFRDNVVLYCQNEWYFKSHETYRTSHKRENFTPFWIGGLLLDSSICALSCLSLSFLFASIWCTVVLHYATFSPEARSALFFPSQLVKLNHQHLSIMLMCYQKQDKATDIRWQTQTIKKMKRLKSCIFCINCKDVN